MSFEEAGRKASTELEEQESVFIYQSRHLCQRLFRRGCAITEPTSPLADICFQKNAEIKHTHWDRPRQQDVY